LALHLPSPIQNAIAFWNRAIASRNHLNDDIKYIATSEITDMSTVQIEIPEEVLISLKETPETIAREVGILAAVKLFELGKLSSGRAAQLAGVSRVEFLMLLGRYQVSPFSLTTEQLERDVNNA
jgi:predicted HTH domain antitoxin